MATILNLIELQKCPGRIETLLGKLANCSWLETTKGNVVCDQLYVYSRGGTVTVYKPKFKKDFKAASKILHHASTGDSKLFAVANSKNGKGAIPISELRSTGEFGIETGSIRLVKENLAVLALRKSLEKAIVTNHGPITLSLDGKKIHNIVAVQLTENKMVKSDAELVDADKQTVVWMSLKDGTSPKQFLQWGGISLTREPKIFRHHETQSFLRDLNKAYPKGLNPGVTVFRRIKDKNVKMMAVYGNDFVSGRLGEQNVSVVLQGPPRIEQEGTSWCLNATRRHYNGESLDVEGYEPVYMAYYTAGRNDSGVLKTRIGIWPVTGRKGEELGTLK